MNGRLIERFQLDEKMRETVVGTCSGEMRRGDRGNWFWVSFRRSRSFGSEIWRDREIESTKDRETESER